MLFMLGKLLEPWFGPFRLLTSYLVLGGVGVLVSSFLTWKILPRLWHKLPTDRGRAHAINAAQSKGKPVGAGVMFIPIFIIATLMFVPFSWTLFGIMVCVGLACLVGFLDDYSGGWSEYRLAVVDLVLSALAATILCGLESTKMWFPLIRATYDIPPFLYIPAATALIWTTINATNCTDGVDGLSGTLTLIAFLYLAGVLYGILGNEVIASYLLVPHYAGAAAWGLVAFIISGCLIGYLWYNANPSAVLMGDAGSRPIGLLLGVLVLASGNPFLILVVGGVVLVNGATGLIKVALLRFLKIGIFHNVRYPLHDHYRHNHQWSNTQVLIRFTIVQALGSTLLMLLLFKIR